MADSSRFIKGVAAEDLAAAYLAGQGFRILGERVRNAGGEIDLIAARGALLVFIEVKARKTVEEAAYAISARQQGRLHRAAEIWLSGHDEGGWAEMRFDAILVSGPGLIRHLENIILSA